MDGGRMKKDGSETKTEDGKGKGRKEGKEKDDERRLGKRW